MTRTSVFISGRGECWEFYASFPILSAVPCQDLHGGKVVLEASPTPFSVPVVKDPYCSRGVSVLRLVTQSCLTLQPYGL